LATTDKTAEEIADISVHGIKSMPPGQWDGSDEDLEKLAKFIDELSP
jgi:menaquinol-cytochrome c reductase cytochrome b/c subunit